MSKYNFPRPRLLIDAGAFALSKDRGATHLQEEVSYGKVIGHPHLRLADISQEVWLTFPFVSLSSLV